MKIKMLVSMYGPNTFMSVNQIIELPDSEAIDLIAAGYAIPARERKAKTYFFNREKAVSNGLD